MLRAPRFMPPGFSLAEVLLAISITGFALLALVGVLPEGLRSLQNAQRQEADARIVLHLAAKYQAKAWEDLEQAGSSSQEIIDFDGNGTFVESTSKDIIYRARAEVMSGLPLPNETASSPYFKRIRIRITNQLNSAAAFETTSRYRERYVTLVNCDKTPDPVTTTASGTSSSSTTTTTGGSSQNP